MDLRIETERGPIRVLRNPYARATVIYIHGYKATVDSAWDDVALQFKRGNVAANLIVPEAPQMTGEAVVWPDLDTLLTVVAGRTGTNTRGPVAVLGHSGAYSTILKWLDHPRLLYVGLLDALYSGTTSFTTWAKKADHRLDVVSAASGTPRINASAIIAKTFSGIPATLTSDEKTARILKYNTWLSPAGIITSNTVIPFLLANRVPLPRMSGFGGLLQFGILAGITYMGYRIFKL